MKNASIIIAVIVVIVLTTGVVLGARGDVYIPFISPNPTKAIEEKMPVAMQTMTGPYRTQVSGTIDVGGGMTGDMRIGVDASMTSTDGFDPKAGNESTMTISLNASGVAFNIGLESRSVEGISYFRLTEIPQIPGLTDLSGLIGTGSLSFDSLQNQWYELDLEELEDGLLDSVGLYPLIPAGTVRSLQEVATNASLQSEQAIQYQKELYELLRAHPPYEQSKRVKAERIDGVASYRYGLTIDPAEATVFISGLLDIGDGIVAERGEANPWLPGFTNLNLDPTRAQFDLLYEQPMWEDLLANTSIDLWLEQQTGLVRKVIVNSAMTIEQDFGEPVELDASFTIILSPIDTAPTIVAPEGAKSLDSIVSDLFGGLVGEEYLRSDEFTTDLNLDGDADELPDLLEEAYGTDPAKPDSDGDGFNDGEEIENGYNPLGEGDLAGSTAEENFLNSFGELTIPLESFDLGGTLVNTTVE